MKKTHITLITSSIVFIEWLEYSVYLYLGVTISKTLLPTDLGKNALVIAFAIFAISYLARPLGALCFGFYSDFLGRKKPLIFSALIIGFATIGIGIIPSYQTIGILAPSLLLGFRLLQSFAISGEFNNSAIFLIEHIPTRSLLAGSLIGMASSAGMFFGSLLAFITGFFDAPALSWRIIYISIGIISFLLMLLRTKLQESPVFLAYLKELKSGERISFLTLIKQYKIGLIQIAAIASFMSVYIYTCNFFFINLLQENYQYSINQATLCSTIVQGLVTILTPIFALLAEKTNFKKLFRFGIILLIIMAPILFISAHHHNHLGIFTGFTLYTLGNSILTAIVFRIMYDYLPVEIRCTGTSFTWSLSAGILGSTSPILATYFINGLKLFYLPAIYIMILGVFAFITSLISTKKAK